MERCLSEASCHIPSLLKIPTKYKCFWMFKDSLQHRKSLKEREKNFHLSISGHFGVQKVSAKGGDLVLFWVNLLWLRKWREGNYFLVWGTMWCSKIRQALANSSPQAGNAIHPFPFRQTTQFPGSTKALLPLLNLKRSETHCSSVDIPFYICYLDVMDRNSTYSPITWPPKFWGKDFVSFSRVFLK